VDSNRLAKAMADYTRRAAADTRPFPYMTAALAILGTLLLLAESITWMVTGQDEYWLLSRWIFMPLLKAAQANPWPTLFIACMAVICGVAAWASRQTRRATPYVRKLDNDPTTQAEWFRNNPPR
jgi:hypothetical protein